MPLRRERGVRHLPGRIPQALQHRVPRLRKLEQRHRAFPRRASGNHPRHLGRRLQASRITGLFAALARPRAHRGVRHGPQPPVPGYRPRRVLREMRLGVRGRGERARWRPNPPLRHQRASASRTGEVSAPRARSSRSFTVVYCFSYFLLSFTVLSRREQGNGPASHLEHGLSGEPSQPGAPTSAEGWCGSFAGVPRRCR